MALTASKALHGSVAVNGTPIKTIHSTNKHIARSTKNIRLCARSRGVEQLGQQHDRHQFVLKLESFKKGPWHVGRNHGSFICPRGLSVKCQSRNTEACECESKRASKSNASRAHHYDDDEHAAMPKRTYHPSQGLADVGKFVHNDAKYVNERAKNDMVLLSRGILSLDARVRQDVAIIGLGFLKLDARARKDTEKIDHGVKKKAERLQHIASILNDKAQSRLKKAADKHWSDGALEADLKRADYYAKQRAIEDALMALEFVKDIHDILVTKMLKLKESPQSGKGMGGNITIEKNGKTLEFFPGEVSSDRTTAIQEAYWSMASALSEADGIDYTDPEELEFLVATLIDLDAMDGKSSVSLLAECSSSPDVNTRKALANALATAPSMWTLGNAGMGALQRLAEDSNPTIAAAASKAIYELKNQWEIKEGDSWRFMMNQNPAQELYDDNNDDDDDDDDGSLY